MYKPSKWLTASVSASLLAGLIAGCSGNSPSEGTPATSNGPDGSSSTAEAPITISFKNQNDGPHDPESPVTKEIEKRLNIKLNYIYLERQKETELLNLKIASGEIPDVMVVQPTVFSSYAQQGVLAEIPEDMIKKFAPKSYAEVKKIAGDNVFEFYKINGKIYGLPIVNVTPYHISPIWRDDWLKNVGITKIPETLQEAETAFYKFVTEDPDKNGKKDTYALSNKGFEAIYGAYGAALQDETRKLLAWDYRNGQVRLSAVLPEMREALKLLNKWYTDGLIDPEFITGENKGQAIGSSVTFWNGRIGFSVPGRPNTITPILDPGNPNDKGSANYQSFTKLQPKGTYAPGTPLSGPAGVKSIIRYPTNTGAAAVFGKNVAKDPKKLEKLLTMWEMSNFDESYYKLANFGLEGVTYDNNPSTGLPTIKGDIDLLKRAAYSIGPNGPSMGVINIELYEKMGMTPKQKQFFNKWGNNVKGYETAVWAALPSEGKYMSNLYNKVMQVYAQFITGTMSPDKDWDAFVEDLNKSGLKELTQEANYWYKKYYGK